MPQAWDAHWVCLDEWLVYHVDHGRARLRWRHDAPRNLHPGDPIAPAALARHLGLSHDYFTRLFRRSIGCPPRRWLLLQRLNQVAVQLRETDRSLDDLAREFGYQDQKLLGRQFQRHLGLSPGRYRRRFRGL